MFTYFLKVPKMSISLIGKKIKKLILKILCVCFIKMMKVKSEYIEIN